MEFKVDFGYNRKEGREYFLNAYLCLSRTVAWADRGQELFRRQFSLAGAGRRIAVACKSIPPVLVQEGSQVLIKGERFALVFDREQGVLNRYEKDGKVLLLHGFAENFFRPPTGIDRNCERDRVGGILSDWLSSGYDRLERRLTGFMASALCDGRVRIDISASLTAPGLPYEILSEVGCTIDGQGRMCLDILLDMDRGLSHAPRAGITMVLPGELEKLRWYGRGPWENYADRKEAALVGLYESTVEEQDFPFIPPCECGGKEDVRWLELLDQDGTGIRVGSGGTFHFDVHHSTVRDMAEAEHAHQMISHPEVYLNIDCRHAGLGGDDGWTQNLHPEYRVQPESYRFRLFVEAVGAE